MKHKLLLSGAAFLFAVFASAQTNVSGFINANTTWTLAGSPYIVTGNALLSQGFTLTIDPGVVVKFDSNKALQIDGQLIAVGTPTQRIVFTSNQPNPQPGDWAKLHFSDFSVDAVYNAAGNYVSGTIMKYCDVLYGGSLMWGSVDIQESSPYISHCVIKDGSWCGINFNGDRLTIDSSRISDLPKRGIYYQGGSFIMRNDTFLSCLEGALHFLSGYNGVQSRIENCFFRLNYGAISGQNGGLHHVTIRNSTFSYNNGPAVVSLSGGGDTLSCNKFRYNTNGPALEMQGIITNGSVVVHNNIIEYNTNTNWWSGASVFYMSVTPTDTVFIANNTIRHNSSPGNACCYFSVALSGLFNTFQFYNNACTENDGLSFMRIDGPQTNDPSFDFMYMNGNTFINPLCTYELYNGVPYGSPNFMVDGNYWGNASTSYVDGVIYDYFDFANQSVVYYSPILTASVALDTSCQPFQLPLGVTEEDPFRGNVQLYPNPSDGNFTITFNDGAQPFDGTIEIFNALSEVVYSTSVRDFTTGSIALPEARGVYFICLTGNEGRWTGRIVRE